MKILRKIFSIFLVLSMIMIMVLTNNCVAKANSDVCEEISILCLNGLRAANPGEKASDYNAGIIPNEGENYTVKNIKIQDSNVSSYRDRYLSNDEIFKTGHTYTVYVTLKANEGYEFSSYPIYQDGTATNIAIVRDSIDYSEVEITYYFYIDEKVVLSNPTVAATYNSDKSVKLTWTPVEDAKYYQIYKYYASTGKIQKSKIVEGTETYFYNLKDSTTYRYIVQAVGDNGESDNVSKDYVVDIKAGKPISGAITNILFNYTNNYLELSWEKVDNVSKYYVYKYYTSSKTLSNPKEVKNTSCRYNIKKSNTSVKYLVSTEKLENLSGYDGRGCICVRVCK
ncbi:hypothetical protein SAMN02910289_00694 [Lachnospiraceae bacterium RM5]|nr:hypothetical protein SAMN02910289_00694 [Lachnospiraceae bacterium RM5]